ncbi:calnexin [Saccharomyces paradoxus]|uniref:Calnexin n=1 Tax=Saccharomyces paradoxus TaxID=27291 RepID=A0A8B8UKT5_SACPA|nr:Cne1 [Saccharomyces paradoxus]QHS71385.1 Cne1 [Saccharomyces paradoxus]
MKFAYLWWQFLNLALVKAISLQSNVTLGNDSFWENFQAYSDTKHLNQEWTTSKATNEEGTKIYGAQWRLSQGRLQGSAWDKAVAVRTSNAAAMIGHLLKTPINVSETDTLVVQYEIKLDNSLTCGGAFIKLVSGFMNVGALENYVPDGKGVELVFGPDYCAPETNSVQFAINKVHKITHKPKLRYLQETPLSKLTDTSQSHLYTLIIDESTQSFQILIDGKTVMAREHIEDKKNVSFEPPITPPLMIPDVSVAKPHDWDDRIRIADPEVVKPSDWDEEEPLMIPDPKDTEPLEWDSSISEYILDPDAEKPSWWQEPEHGEWIPLMIKNPLCTAKHGCGQWIPRLIKNPKYKGSWEPTEVINPNYMGEWHSPETENPLYYEERQPLRIENEISGVILEFWSGSPNMLISNIYVGKNVTEAQIIGNKTWLMRDRAFRGLDDSTERKFMNNRLGNLQATFQDEKESPNPFDRIIDYVLEQPPKSLLTAAAVFLSTLVLCYVVST